MPLDSPIISFTILIAAILIIPPVFERLRLPGLVGLLVAGVILGQSGLRLLNSESDTIQLLSDIGKIYLMFVAGLEIDLVQFRKTRDRSIGFGFLTFIVPLVTGIGIGQLFHFGWNASFLIGSLLASHTLLAYPIVSRLGVVTNEAVTVTIGATIFTDTGALLVLAICVGIHAGGFSSLSLFSLLAGLAIYAVAILFGLDWAGKAFFQRSGDEEGKQFLFILLALFIASVGAQVIGVEKIVGAFLAGLAVNDVLGRSPIREKIEFVGSVLFIPCFFVDMGLLIDIPAFLKTLGSLGLTAAIVGGLIGSKFVAAWLAKLWYGYSRNEGLTMWSLSLPQVAATLAATLVAYQSLNPAGDRLIPETVLNSVIVLMIVTSILGPILTAKFANQLPLASSDSLHGAPSIWWEDQYCDISDRTQRTFKVLVPIYNPQTQRNLLELAALLSSHEAGQVVTLAIAKAHIHMDAPELETTLTQTQQLLDQAIAIGEDFGVPVTTKIRIDDEVALGISRTSREVQANLVVMGWSSTTGLRARLFGSVIDKVFWSSHCPVAVTKLRISPAAVRRILVPVDGLTEQSARTVRFAQVLADVNQAQVILLHIFPRRTASMQMEQFMRHLLNFVARDQTASTIEVKTLAHDNVAVAILQEARTCDLIVLHTIRHRTSAGLEVSNVTSQVVQEAPCSFILFGERA
ncbi:cation:proton antiporter [Alkalinema sp. FACHB-956]|uniref:cation:proton antiporter domain-containing protein n=1 Tax=Alkalinema sp. FACHB-956 TaxID=2692768 RepID=UPI001688E9F3|nr:cation:proton antiporter [Alkalinema sp. FACHB-956]MBD2329627.1 cation:proton antiporter [Alkalinema sp. FACHB-956]